MKRRALLLASSAALIVPSAILAQAQKAPRRIAVVLPGTRAGYRPHLEALRGELKKLGYVEGRDISIDTRWAGDRLEDLESLAAEAAVLNPEVIVTASSAGIAAVKKAAPSIPIVFATAATPVEQGFVASFAHPGGNITGVSVHAALHQKLIEIAREALPSARRLALLLHVADPAHESSLRTFEPNARRFKFEPIIVRFRKIEELDGTFRELAEKKADALLLPNLTIYASQRNEFISRALKARLPLLTSSQSIVASGALLGYGTSPLENYRRAAILVDKILRGAKPAELPVDQPERFHLVLNRKTAQAIGVTLPPALMLRVDRVIE